VAVVMMSASSFPSGLHQDALLGERVNLIGNDRCLTGGQRLEQIAVGHRGFELPLQLVDRCIDGADPEARRIATKYLESHCVPSTAPLSRRWLS
jgi:hypothetical protein